MNERGEGQTFTPVFACLSVWWPTFVYWLFHWLSPRALPNHKQPSQRVSFVRTCHGRQLSSSSTRHKMSAMTFKCLSLYLDQWTTKNQAQYHSLSNVTFFDSLISCTLPMSFLFPANKSYAMAQKSQTLGNSKQTDESKWGALSAQLASLWKIEYFSKRSGTRENEKLLSIKVLVLLGWSCMHSRVTLSLQEFVEDLLWWRKSERDPGSFE